MVSIQEILNSVCGKQENSNLPRCSTNVSTGVLIEATKETKMLAEANVIKPAISLQRHDEFIVCDLNYISAFDQDLREAYNIFELFGSNLNDAGIDDYEVGDRRIPYLVVTLTALQGYDHVVSLTSPITWSLTSDKPGSTPNTIRVLFRVEDVCFFEGQLLDEAKRIEEEIKKNRLRTDMAAVYYDQVEENARKKEEEKLKNQADE